MAGGTLDGAGELIAANEEDSIPGEATTGTGDAVDSNAATDPTEGSQDPVDPSQENTGGLQLLLTSKLTATWFA